MDELTKANPTDESLAGVERQVAWLREVTLRVRSETDIRTVMAVRGKAAALKSAVELLLPAKHEHKFVAAEACLEAERQLGTLLTEQLPHKGGRPGKNPDTVSGFPTLKELGVNEKQSQRYQRLAAIEQAEWDRRKAEVRDDFVNRELTRASFLTAAKEQERKKERAERRARDDVNSYTVDDLQALADDGKRFATVYADPPWPYSNQATRAATGKHYETPTLEWICGLPTAQLADEKAHLHLWTTNAFIFDAKAVIEAWGFEYKSCMVWVKPEMGIGNYWRVSHEFLLLGVRGGLTFDERDRKSWIEHPRGKHSKKPYVFRKNIEDVSPPARLELFGREEVQGWTVWGNEVERSLLSQTA